MFTGIVEEVGFVFSKLKNSMVIQASENFSDVKLGDSINVSGVCLTVVEKTDCVFSVDLADETLKKTNLDLLIQGGKVNLERALTPVSRLGGHYVQGHVDDVGKVMKISGKSVDRIISIKAPENLLPYIVQKGFIAVNGVSLTIVSADGDDFSFTLVPFSAENTNLGSITVGDHVNLEVDIMAKYIERIIDKKRGI